MRDRGMRGRGHSGQHRGHVDILVERIQPCPRLVAVRRFRETVSTEAKEGQRATDRTEGHVRESERESYACSALWSRVTIIYTRERSKTRGAKKRDGWDHVGRECCRVMERERS